MDMNLEDKGVGVVISEFLSKEDYQEYSDLKKLLSDNLKHIHKIFNEIELKDKQFVFEATFLTYIFNLLSFILSDKTCEGRERILAKMTKDVIENLTEFDKFSAEITN